MVIHHGDCLDVMAQMDQESVDAIVTDPPYGLSFMAKEWDAPGAVGGFPMRRSKAINTVNTGLSRQGGRQQQGLDFQKRQRKDMEAYQESMHAFGEAAYRVAKPSAYLLAFGGTRTVHRMTVALEDAGWIIRDMLVWAYASGFPKSKASLKPAWEPIVMARKPGPLRMLAIDECRIPSELEDGREVTFRSLAPGATVNKTGDWKKDETVTKAYPSGRWPANVALTDPIFDGDVEGVVGGGESKGMEPALLRRGATTGSGLGYGSTGSVHEAWVGYGDAGTYSRFFLIPKADRIDREPLIPKADRIDREPLIPKADRIYGKHPRNRKTKRQNVHPTVKPTELMRHLVRLVTPSGGTVLDPFLGSGTTALAAEMEGFAWIGIEREAEYVAIAEARLNGTQRGLGLETA